MKVLIDTNIIIDFATNREPFAEQAQKIFELVNNSEIEGFIASHSIPNLFYILRKSMDSTSLRLFLLGLCNLLTVVCIDETMMISGLQNISFSDFEDCLQSECAEKLVQNILSQEIQKILYTVPYPLLLQMIFLTSYNNRKTARCYQHRTV